MQQSSAVIAHDVEAQVEAQTESTLRHKTMTIKRAISYGVQRILLRWLEEVGLT
jgi:hypothetical protein